ncbi:MAG: 3-dehydroquinate synthase, partial [Clostridia bacterium]|nr:3-dehydroquinate synthase [Clostridia bacterium]
MMETVSVRTTKPYEVRIEKGLLAKTGEELYRLFPGARVMLVSDDTVDSLYSPRVEASHFAAGVPFEKFVFPHGESSKCANVWLSLLEYLAEKSFTRTDVLLALGGGV